MKYLDYNISNLEMKLYNITNATKTIIYRLSRATVLNYKWACQMNS